MARTGRRPGPTETRSRILEAGRSEFAVHGYERASIRAIAARAGVDPALVIHYFGSKEGAFVAAMELPTRPDQVLPRVLEGGPERLGERIVQTLLGVWDRPSDRRRLVGLLRSAVTHDRAAAMLREFLGTEVFGPVAASLGVPDAEVRAGLAASQMLGLILARYVLRLPPVARLSTADLVARYAPLVQHALTG